MAHSISLLSALMTCTLLSACATSYNQVDEDVPHATLNFVDGNLGKKLGFGSSSDMAYIMYPDGNCKKPEIAARFMWGATDSKQVRVQADKPLTFLAMIEDLSTPEPSKTLYENCSIIGEFTPKKQNSYMINLSGTGSTCVLKVTNTSTGEELSELKTRHPEYDGFSC